MERNIGQHIYCKKKWFAHSWPIYDVLACITSTETLLWRGNLDKNQNCGTVLNVKNDDQNIQMVHNNFDNLDDSEIY
jgi:hypothetical protein